MIEVKMRPLTEIKGILGSIACHKVYYMRFSRLVTCKYLFACHRDTQALSLEEYENLAGAFSSNYSMFQEVSMKLPHIPTLDLCSDSIYHCLKPTRRGAINFWAATENYTICVVIGARNVSEIFHFR